ncbi:MAG: hypothetical protein GTO14_23535 [Anaerolineales bacterium]|nr:hypothetical protein [Anaerolineales bacterium]
MRGTDLIFTSTPEIPSWVQLPKRTLVENMMLQFTEGMPGLVQEEGKFYFDTGLSDYVEQLTTFYAQYLAAVEEDDLDVLQVFRLSPAYAAGFEAFLARLHEQNSSRVMLKGQVTGPFTLGVNLLDQNRRCAYYDDTLRDVVVKTVALKAKWQLAQLRAFELPVVIFLDEPSLLAYGSQTFITVSREDIINDINEVVALIHAQGALAGVHCEEDTDWSLLMTTDLDILSFDAYDHLQAMTLYPAELQSFLRRGGNLAWGIVPTLDQDTAATETLPSLLSRFENGLDQFERKGFDRMFLLRRALITPSCGAGGVLTEPLAERVLHLLSALSHTLRDTYSFTQET